MSTFHESVQEVVEECLKAFGEAGPLVFAAKTLVATRMISEERFQSLVRGVERGLQDIPGIPVEGKLSIHLALLLISDVFNAHGVAVVGVAPNDDGRYGAFELAMSNVPGIDVQDGLVVAAEKMAVRLREAVDRIKAQH